MWTFWNDLIILTFRSRSALAISSCVIFFFLLTPSFFAFNWFSDYCVWWLFDHFFGFPWASRRCFVLRMVFYAQFRLVCLWGYRRMGLAVMWPMLLTTGLTKSSLRPRWSLLFVSNFFLLFWSKPIVASMNVKMIAFWKFVLVGAVFLVVLLKRLFVQQRASYIWCFEGTFYIITVARRFSYYASLFLGFYLLTLLSFFFGNK